jgi:hypothetical protein
MRRKNIRRNTLRYLEAASAVRQPVPFVSPDRVLKKHMLNACGVMHRKGNNSSDAYLAQYAALLRPTHSATFTATFQKVYFSGAYRRMRG